MGPFVKRVVNLITLLSFWAIVSSSHAKIVQLPHPQIRAHDESLASLKSITTQINRILASSKNQAKIGIEIRSATNGTILYTKNAQQAFVPASNLKLFTAFAALQKLGPDFRFKTQLLTDSRFIHQGVLNGNVYLKFSGDPAFKFKDLEQLVATLSQQGIHTITGRVITDYSDYNGTGIAMGTLAEDKKFCYGAPVNAMIFNQNCVAIDIKPGLKPGQRAQLAFNNAVPIPLNNQVVTQAVAKNCHLALKDSGEGYALTGCIGAKSPATRISLAINDSQQYGMQALRLLLNRHHIQVKNALEHQSTHLNSLQVLATHDSEPLKALVDTMLKKSDNIIANSLFKRLGADHFQQPGNWENGRQAMQAILAQNAIDHAGLVMIDGSGLSRSNLVTPAQINQLLIAAYHKPDLANYFIPALPLAGINGTLKHRMQLPATIGKIAAKTGTMKGVSSLSGYVDTVKHGKLAFSILVNDGLSSPARYRILEDKICHYLSTI